MRIGVLKVTQGNETRMGKGKGSFEYWATRYVSDFVSDVLGSLIQLKGWPLVGSSSRLEVRPFGKK